VLSQVALLFLALSVLALEAVLLALSLTALTLSCAHALSLALSFLVL
jgi:hypothetical protein